MDSRVDGQLLADVAASQSQEAFEELVRRHGAMVLNESLRLLSDRHEAEDVAQAVFLVLWKKAKSLRHRSSVAPWLHRVARNVCRNAWRSNLTRKIKERNAMEARHRDSAEDNQWNEIKDVLDEELDRLPAKYRLPLILFHLEGRQIDEIARLTNTKTSTVASQLRRARELLRNRISRRGITVGAGALLAAVDLHARSADLSASFAATTAKTAGLFGAGKLLPGTALPVQSVHLAQGALKMLAVAKIKVLTTVIASAVLAVGLLSAVPFTILQASTPAPEGEARAEQQPVQIRAVSDGETDGLNLQTIIATLEKQREQVKSLTIETKNYSAKLVPPQVLNSLQRFRGRDFTNQEEQLQEYVFAYKGGQRYLRTFITIMKKSDDDKTTVARRVTYNSEKASDGKRVWERRVDLKRGPAQVFMLPVKPGEEWTSNPVYCGNFGWDCRTELHTQDEAALKSHRRYDFLSLLKEGAFTVDAGTTMLDGVKCVVLRREYEAELWEFDPRKEENVVFKAPATETIWLDVDRGFAMQQREHQNERWGLDRTINSEFVEILPGIWFPQKTKSQPHAPPGAAKEYQGRPILSWHQDLVRWSVNDVPDNRFDIITKPSDHLIERGKPIRVIGDDGQPIDPTPGNSKPNASITDEQTKLKAALKAQSADEERLVDLLAKAGATAKPESAKLRVAIATGERCNPPESFIELLGSQLGCQCEAVPLADMDEGALKSYDVVLIPGGHAESQAKELGESGLRAIREFVETGGGYVGVCAGAKLATTNFDWSLKLINAQTLSDQRQSPGPDGVMTVDMGKRGSGDVKMELTDAGRKILAGPNGLIETAFRLSPVLLPNQQSDLPRCVSLGDYRSEVWLHSLHIGTMVNTPSILAARYGKGRVIIFSSHPEGREETGPMLVRAVLATAHKPAVAD